MGCFWHKLRISKTELTEAVITPDKINLVHAAHCSSFIILLFLWIFSEPFNTPSVLKMKEEPLVYQVTWTLLSLYACIKHSIIIHYSSLFNFILTTGRVQPEPNRDSSQKAEWQELLSGAFSTSSSFYIETGKCNIREVLWLSQLNATLKYLDSTLVPFWCLMQCSGSQLSQAGSHWLPIPHFWEAWTAALFARCWAQAAVPEPGSKKLGLS